MTTSFAELFDSTPGTAASLEATPGEVEQSGLAFHIEHMRQRLTT